MATSQKISEVYVPVLIWKALLFFSHTPMVFDAKRRSLGQKQKA
jgi:hypothetical protein